MLGLKFLSSFLRCLLGLLILRISVRLLGESLFVFLSRLFVWMSYGDSV